MCTLIAGLDVLGPGTLLVGANRDESPERPSADPGVLRAEPRVVGGLDERAGGSWLAVRDARFVSALLNRRPEPGDPRDPKRFRSRGLLCLESAVESSREGALTLATRDPYGHCTLVGLDADGSGWALHIGHEPPVATSLGPGWHVVTHRDVDDLGEPRTRSLIESLREAHEEGAEAAIERLEAMLRRHGDAGAPAVCLHGVPFPTVSSSILLLGRGAAPHYLHAAGPPCVTPYRDLSALLAQDLHGER